MQSPRNRWAIVASVGGKIRRIEKFPVVFPVSRKFASGDGFDYDCVRHHFSSEIQRVAEAKKRRKKLGTARQSRGRAAAEVSTARLSCPKGRPSAAALACADHRRITTPVR